MKSLKFLLPFFLMILNMTYAQDEEVYETTVLFPKNEAVITTDQRTKLDSLLNFIKTFDVKKIELSGHTDEEGSQEYNLKLSKSRVMAVQNYFITDSVNSTLIITDFSGKEKLISDNHLLNRRVEISIYYRNREDKLEEPCVGTPIKVMNRYFFIDIDENGDTDFTLTYNSVGNGHSNGSWSGSLYPDQGLQFLYALDKSHLHLKKGDTISVKLPEGKRWFNLSNTVVVYDKLKKKWSTQNKNDSEILYLALLSGDGDQHKIGWIKFYFNSCTGEHEVLNYYFTEDDFVVIDK